MLGAEREIAAEHAARRALHHTATSDASSRTWRTCPMVAYDLGVPGLSSVEYILTNPSAARRCCSDAPRSSARQFDDPVHSYQAVEVTLNRRFVEQLVGAGLVPLVAPARQLRRLLPRRQRPVRPRHHVALRLPDQRSELHGDRRAAVRLSGRHPLSSAIRTASCRSTGRTRSRCSGTTRSRWAELRRRLQPQLRRAADAARRAIRTTRNGGEIPEAPRGSGIQTVDGFKTRTPFQRRSICRRRTS